MPHTHIERVAVIGAGFAGLCMAIRLRRAGIHDFTVFEKADDVGGVWRDNTYPGAGCDVPSVLYSYSFAQHGRWSRSFPLQREILAYLRRCVEDHEIGDHIRYGTEIVAAEWDEGESAWRLRTADGGEHAARVLVTGVGQLNRPRYPAVPGVGKFGGVAFHSAEWRHDHDLTGKRVAVIGTGPSAVQFVPEVAKQAAQLYVFQRSANWVVPKPDHEHGSLALTLLDKVAPIRLLKRGMTYLRGETVIYWAIKGGRLAKLAEWAARKHLRTQIADPVLRAKLTPDFPIGCKRILISDDWYPALARENVEVVTSPVSRIIKTGVDTADGVHRGVDTLIYGTGFLATEFLKPIEVVGKDGTRLHEVWKDGAAAYLGITVPAFPNMYMLYGPGTNLGHNSIIYMIESQAEYVLRKVLAGGVHEVSQKSFDAHQELLGTTVADSAFSAGCDSWYKNADGKVTTNWALRTLTYRSMTRKA
ncbi:flavin-containing monooxygenase [Yinghuangia seranimata]|uniref:flavin-containing monooxygenase n=1 Tax=Yinghuangia seranimata TaxID=408067 RepID=UPI00248D034E|nr:NAD(P)/FAD-dependent oxidoreductase [Yinghuangia seranimata]MDI2128213.1 NAD(P)/FAD-dependent oxidoreductase [Yinghuangia seranimata]